ncbi:hypothetical protein PIN31009_00337 [Pandoraea iniqua]|uniref:hypothetical protein n=1 Tax=Pandoraea iniqua TaxID=2508288 RepID=UPI001241E052|nr:hypothetical protein [Pandoraea iniqua]VVD65657.1 hypothetical protein PIN31009_00337 [Pandoraea iniqua]
MPALQPCLTSAPTPGCLNVSAPVVLPGIAGSRASAFNRHFDNVSNRMGDASVEVTGNAPTPRIAHSRHTREIRKDGCITRYPTQGGFTRDSRYGAREISPQDHTRFLRTNAENAVFGELLTLLRPKRDCPNGYFQDNATLRGELWKRIQCLKIDGYVSVNGMAVTHKIPSLLIDDAKYLPGSPRAIAYDIGFETLSRHGLDAGAILRKPVARVEAAGRAAIRHILAERPDGRDPYRGFTHHFKSLQFHAHANGMQDATDMLDRITRDDSFGHPVTGPTEAADFLANNASPLKAHLRRCHDAAKPSRWQRFVGTVFKYRPLPMLLRLFGR